MIKGLIRYSIFILLAAALAYGGYRMLLPATSKTTPAEKAEDPRLDRATEALNAGDFDAATAVYDEILAEDPANAEIKQAKATVAVLKRVEAQAEPADEVERQLQLADRQFVAGDPEAAFDGLLALVKTEPRAKERLLELLDGGQVQMVGRFIK